MSQASTHFVGAVVFFMFVASCTSTYYMAYLSEGETCGSPYVGYNANVCTAGAIQISGLDIYLNNTSTSGSYPFVNLVYYGNSFKYSPISSYNFAIILYQDTACAQEIGYFNLGGIDIQNCFELFPFDVSINKVIYGSAHIYEYN